MESCVAVVFRGIRQEKCGKPAKVFRVAAGRAWPVCGIHWRTRLPLIEIAPGRMRAALPAGHWVEP